MAVLAVIIIETSCYRIILPTYRTPRTRRPIIRRARDVEFVRAIGEEARELYNEDDGMFTDRPYLYEEENYNIITPMKNKMLPDIANGVEGSSYNSDQYRRFVEVTVDHDHEDSSYNGPNNNVKDDNESLERSVRSVDAVNSRRVIGRPGNNSLRSKLSKIAQRDHVNRLIRAVDFGNHLPNIYHNPLESVTRRPVRNPIYVNRLYY